MAQADDAGGVKWKMSCQDGGPFPDAPPLLVDTCGCVDLSLNVPTNLKLNDKLIEETVKLGNFRSKQEAVNTALAEFVQRRQRLRILELEGKIDFDPDWNHKKMRRGRS